MRTYDMNNMKILFVFFSILATIPLNGCLRNVNTYYYRMAKNKQRGNRWPVAAEPAAEYQLRVFYLINLLERETIQTVFFFS